MSVLIMGMPMPKSCKTCKFRTCYLESLDPFTDFCYLTNARLGYYDNKRAKWQHERKKGCPLVEVSEDAVSPCEVCPLVKVDETAILDGWDKVYPDDDEVEPRYCDRNICVANEYNGIECDECEVTKHNERMKEVEE